MANFPTHIAIGTIVSGALATVTLATELVAPKDIVAVTLAGVLGSVLPDIDLKDSRPSRAMFSGLAIFFSFVVLFGVENRYSIAEMLILWLGTLLIVRYVGGNLFHRFSYHRGIWHSLVAALFCGAFTAVVFYQMLGREESVAWLGAGFLMIGYLTHLTLDEIYSVDVMDTRIKSSFGTALKFIDARHPLHTGAMVAALLCTVPLLPSATTFVHGITSRQMWSNLHLRLLPPQHWFGIDWRGTAWMPGAAPRSKEGAVPANVSTMSTGSIEKAQDKPKE